MGGDKDVTGGRLTIAFYDGTHRTVELSEVEAYELLKCAKDIQSRHRKTMTVEELDRIVWPMYQAGMSVPDIANRMEISQLRVEGTIKRVLAGRYGIEGGFKNA